MNRLFCGDRTGLQLVSDYNLSCLNRSALTYLPHYFSLHRLVS